MCLNIINLHSIICSLLQLGMFSVATAFNQAIGNWDVSSGTQFVSLGRIHSHCSFWFDVLEHTQLTLYYLFIAEGWNELCEYKVDSFSLFILI